MSRGAWRGAETLQKRRREQLAIERAEERARKRRREIVKEWHVTGEAAFRPTERSYPNGGGVHGVAEFLASTERALHLYDRSVEEYLHIRYALCNYVVGVGASEKSYYL